MIQEIAPKKFDNAYHAKSPKPDDFVLVFRGHGKPDDRVLCRIEDGKIVSGKQTMQMMDKNPEQKEGADCVKREK